MKILRLPTVKAEMGHRSDASIYNAIRAGLFPVGVQIGQRARGWPDYEVKAINSARIAGKSEDEIRNIVKILYTKRSEMFFT
jgi:prophage regulatory protein